MIQDIKIGVIGGDVRSLTMAGELAKEGFSVSAFALPEPQNAEKRINICSNAESCTRGARAIILGVPYSADGKYINCALAENDLTLGGILDTLTPETPVLGGRFDSIAYKLASERGIKLIDYFESQELAILNAVPTAEGAIELAMRETDITLYSSSVLVLGFGRIGKVLAKALHALGAEVCVAARKSSDRASARVMGYKSCDISQLPEVCPGADFIFNTVPSMLLGKMILNKIQKNTLIIDLASRPGGVDMKAAKELSSRVIWALSLPGKVAPISAGRYIKDAVMSILCEEGIL